MRQLDEGDADRVAEEARLQAEDADRGQDAEGADRADDAEAGCGPGKEPLFGRSKEPWESSSAGQRRSY